MADRDPLPPRADAPPLCSRRELIRQGACVLALLGIPADARAQGEIVVDRFADIASLLAPEAAQRIRTLGWRDLGVGGARYVWDPRVDRAWVTRFPRSAAISANGRGFRLETIGGDVRRYGAAGDGRIDDTAAINEALARGGTVVLAGPATYIATDRLLVSVAGTRLFFEDAVTLRTRAWRYRGSQTPFGNAIHVTGDDCEVIGSGSGSVLQNAGGDANGIGFLHCGGGRVARLTLRGGKADMNAIIDDSFQSGVSVVNDRTNNAGGRPSAVVIEDCRIVDWVQYGVNIYGDLAADIILRGNLITDAGKQGDRLSVGAGIALTRGVGPVVVDNNTIADNKGYGVLVSSAGAEVHDVAVSRNAIMRNGLDGIRCSEEKQFGATGGIGQLRIAISDNRIEANGGAGVRVGTYDGLGSIRGMTILRNRIASNAQSGVLLQANAAPDRNVSARVDSNEFVLNGEYGLAVGLNRVDLQHSGNRFDRNRRGPTIDFRGGVSRPLTGS